MFKIIRSKRLEEIEERMDRVQANFDKLISLDIRYGKSIEKRFSELEKTVKIHNDVLKSLNKKFPKYL